MSTIAINKGDWVGTKEQYAALASIDNNRKYYITDLETFAITNSAMASALTTYSALYYNNDIFLCIDDGTYHANTFYKFYNGAWVELGGLSVQNQYATKLNFPNIGDSKTLYVDMSDNSVWRFDTTNLVYVCVGRDYTEIETINGGNA